MNLLKSIFISAFLMINMGFSIVAVGMIATGRGFAGWFGVLLVSFPVVSVLGTLMITKKLARTSANFPVLQFLAVAGVVIAVGAATLAAGGFAEVILAVTAYIGLFLYVYWYSRLPRERSETLKIGERLPDFTLADSDGSAVTSAELSSAPAILMFYRGNWCPLCMAQIHELVDQYRRLRELGVRVALISPQPHENTIALARKFNVEFDFLTDEGNVAARALGISMPNGVPMGMQMMGYDSETVLPTVVIVGRDGRIAWTHETDNYRVRPEPDVFLDVLGREGIAAGV